MIVQKHDPEGPPPYESQTAGGSSRSTIYPPVPTDLQANNFLAISRTYDALKGRYIIDTALEIPESLLPDLGEPEDPKDEERLAAGERPNLKLSGQHGSMAADVWIVNSKGEENGEGETKRAFVEVTNAHGSVKLQVVSRPPWPL